MGNSTKYVEQQIGQTGLNQISLKVRTNVRAGAWKCGNCVGTVNGNQMIKPACDYCQPS